MQKELKNQIQTKLHELTLRGTERFHSLFDPWTKEIKQRLASHPLPLRWPSILTVLEEVAPQLLTPAANFLSHQSSSVAEWLDLKIVTWEDYRISVVVDPKPYLLNKGTLPQSLLSLSSELSVQWLLEKHIPPGELNCQALKIQFEQFKNDRGPLTIRTEFDVNALEIAIGQLLSGRIAEMMITSLIFNAKDALLGEVHSHFNLNWRPLLK